MKKSDLKTKTAPFNKIVKWSKEDDCFVGSAPPLIGPCCHGRDEAKVYLELSQIVEEWIQILDTGIKRIKDVAAGRIEGLTEEQYRAALR